MVIKSVFDISKLKQGNNRWMKKEEEKQKKEKEDLTPEMRQLRQYEEDMKRIREQRPKADIDAKLKAGADLTPDEVEYLKKNDPEAYKEYEEVQREKENYKKQLRNCKTKEDVERLKLNKMGQFMAEAKSVSQNPNIPKGKKLQLMEKILKKTIAVQQVHIEFTRTSQYKSLPTEEEEMEKEARKKEAAEADIMEEEGEAAEIEEAEAAEETEGIETGETEIEKGKETEAKELNKEKTLDIPNKKIDVKTDFKSEKKPTAEFEETKAVIMQELDRFSRVRGSVRK